MEHVGLILGIEMSRLARCNEDWHHLLQMCSIFGTILADEDGLYDPRDPNDRLLLGLKGTMSEYELVTMHNRLEGGKRLQGPAVRIDPQRTVRLLKTTHRRGNSRSR